MSFIFKVLKSSVLLSLLIGQVSLTIASDHDDGVSSLKNQAVNLTDLYVFR